MVVTWVDIGLVALAVVGFSLIAGAVATWFETRKWRKGEWWQVGV